MDEQKKIKWQLATHQMDQNDASQAPALLAIRVAPSDTELESDGDKYELSWLWWLIILFVWICLSMFESIVDELIVTLVLWLLNCYVYDYIKYRILYVFMRLWLLWLHSGHAPADDGHSPPRSAALIRVERPRNRWNTKMQINIIISNGFFSKNLWHLEAKSIV